jgi:hypothetical protein
MCRRGPTTASAVVLAAIAAVSLTGCGGDPEPTPTPTPSATATPTPTPTPSPTVPVPAEYDATWTKDQLEAVKLVEAYHSLDTTMRKDPQNEAHWATMPKIATDPLLFGWMTAIQMFQDSGERNSEDVETIHVAWSVGPVQDVDGQQEINLSWCVTGPPLVHVIQADGQVIEVAPERVLGHSTAQFIPDVGWRLIDSEGGTEPC